MRHEWEDPTRFPAMQSMRAEAGRLFAKVMGVESEVDGQVAQICAREILRLASGLAEERERNRFLRDQNSDLTNMIERLKKGKEG